MEEIEGFEPTSAEDYPVVEDVQLELPSGAKVIVRQPNVFGMMSRGRIPAELFEAMQSGTLDVQQVGRLTNAMVAEAFVKPPVSLVPKKGHVLLANIPNGDIAAVVKALGIKV